MTQTRPIRWAGVLLLALGMLCHVGGCSKPTVRLHDVSLTRMTTEELELALGFEVKNPNPVALPLETLTYGFNAGDDSIADGTLEAAGEIPANSTVRLEAPLRVYFRKIEPLVRRVRGGEDLAYESVTEATFSVLGMSLPVTMKQGGRLMAFFKPVWVLRDVQILSADASRLGVVVDITNPNKFSLALAGLNGSLRIGDTTVVEVDRAVAAELPGGQTTRVEFPVRIQALSLARKVASELAAGRKPEFTGEFELAAPADLNALFLPGEPK